MIYLDNNATTAIDPRVAEVMHHVACSGPLNPSSQHAAGRRARRLLDDAVVQIGRLLGAAVDRPGGERLIITSGGTEANQLALHGLGPGGCPWIISTIEHPSLLQSARAAQAAGRTVHWLPVDRRGIVSIAALDAILSRAAGDAPVVAIMAANNETGVLQPVQQAAERCRSAGALLHVDATQWAGKLPLDFRQLGADAVALAAHKFHGPVGVGGLLLRAGLEIRPLWAGGAQQLGSRPGTEPVALAAGMAEALRIAVESMQHDRDRIERLRNALERGLCEACGPVVIHGGDAPRLPGTSSIAFPGADRQSLLMTLDLAGVACSTGSACASGSSQPSHVLQAMGAAASEIASSLRLGLSRFSTSEEIDSAIGIISRAYANLTRNEAVEK